MIKPNFPDRSTLKTVVAMAWPAILESFFVALAGLIDSYMVSTIDTNGYAVAAVGLTTQPKFLGLAMFFAVNVSVSALVARRLGEKDRKDGNRVALTAFTFVILMAILFSILFTAFASPIIEFCGSTENTHADAVVYFQIIMGGMIFNCVQMVVNAAQRGSGNTRITMTTNIVSNTVNVIPNSLLIGGNWGFPKLGVRGAAIATVLGTVVACIMSICSIAGRKTFISIRFMIAERLRPAISAVKSLIHVGYGIFFEQMLMRFGFMMTAIMAASAGDAPMAAHQVGMNILSLSFAFGDGLQSAAVALIGRSLGQGDHSLAKKYGSTCKWLGMAISGVLAIVYLLGGRTLYNLFFPENEEIISLGVMVMTVIVFVVFFQISQVIYMGCLRGAGDTLYTAIVSTLCVSIIRTAVSAFFYYIIGWGLFGIWLGVLADQLGRFILGGIRYRKGKWVNIKI